MASDGDSEAAIMLQGDCVVVWSGNELWHVYELGAFLRDKSGLEWDSRPTIKLWDANGATFLMHMRHCDAVLEMWCADK